MLVDADELRAVRARRAWGEWLSGFPWDHYVTLTSRHPITSTELEAAFHNEFERSLARKAQQAVRYFWRIEGGDRLGGFHHLHALLHGTAGLTTASVARAWSRGFTDVRQYDSQRLGTWYVTKAMVGEDDLYGLSRHMPPR